MEVLNAASSSFTPVSVLQQHSRTQHRNNKQISQRKFPKFSTFEPNPVNLRRIKEKFLVLSSVLNAGVARALTYEEALEQSAATSSSSSGGSFEFDFNGFVDSVVNFGTENPGIVIGGAVVLVVPLVLSQVLKKPKAWGIESARNAYAKLGEEANAQLLDIRSPVDFREVGSPDIRGLKKKAVSIFYKGDNKSGFLKKLGLKFKDPENTTLFILDKLDGNSELVAELVTLNGFKAAYAIKDGAEGPRGWLKSGLSWLPPKNVLSFDFGSLTEAFAGANGDGSDALPVTLGLVAATGLGVLVFTEVETILQIVGSAALVQFISNKILFAEDRKKTLQQVDEFLNTKIAPKELADEIKQIGKALLTTTSDTKALPVPAEGSPSTAIPETPVQKDSVETPPETINSTARTEVKEESLSGFSSPLSPYSAYPDYKPPSSPSPSPP